MSQKAKDMVTRPSPKLDKQLASLDRSHQARQNRLAAPGSFTTTSPQFLKRAASGAVPPPMPPKR